MESRAVTPSPATSSPRFPPGPPVRKGLIRSLRYYAAFAQDPIGFVKSRFDAYGDIYYAPNKDGGLFVVRHPDHVREVLATRASSYRKEHTALTQLKRVLGDGLLISDGDTWKRQRRMVQPAFAPPRMAAYGDVMTDEARRTADGWAGQTGRVLSIDSEMTALTLRIVSRTLFGHDVSEHDIHAIARAMTAFQSSLSSPDFLPAWLALPGRRALARGLDELDRIVYRLIRERSELGADAGGPRADLLQLLVDAVDLDGPDKRARLTEGEVRDQLVTLFLAGHETTSQALTWTFYCLSQSPEARAALHAELDDVLAGRTPTPADLERLPYTEQVITEAMRLYPPVYAVARRACEDTEIGGYSVPRGSEVVVWICMTHRDPRFYPEPEAFRPERFDKDRMAELPKLAYLPFGGGPRACIGKAFAMMEARLILATLAQRFCLELAPGQRVSAKPRITLTPKHGMRMVLARR
jgi:cytochrome P450